MGLMAALYRIRRDASLSAVNAGLLTVIIGFTSSVVVVLDAARSLGADAVAAGSWLLALCLGMALLGIYYSMRLRVPIAVAWSTSGAAVIAASAAGLSLAEAVGAFMVCGALLAVTGWLRWVEKILALIPPAIAAALLAGVLLRYGLGLFQAAERELLLVLVMLTTFVLMTKLAARYAVSVALLVGVGWAYLRGQFSLAEVEFVVARPVWVTPEFSLAAAIGLGLPLFMVTMASQNLPGAAVLRASEFRGTEVSPIIAGTGVMTLLLAPFGAYTLNLAAITATICIGPEAHPEPARRYVAAVFAALFYAIAGLFGSIVVQVCLALPGPLLAACAGIALLGVLVRSFADAMADARARLSASITLLCTASGVAFAGISPAFWALVVGVVVHFLIERPVRAVGGTQPSGPPP